MTDYYREKKAEGEEFQDFAMMELYRQGIVVTQFCSRKYQIEQGESHSGIEIKYDGRAHETGNLYFEFAEKSDPHNGTYVRSGFMRDDNTWLWCIGDYDNLWLIPKSTLQRLYGKVKRNRRQMERTYGITVRKTATSWGFTVPCGVVTNELCCKHIRAGGRR